MNVIHSYVVLKKNSDYVIGHQRGNDNLKESYFLFF